MKLLGLITVFNIFYEGLGSGLTVGGMFGSSPEITIDHKNDFRDKGYVVLKNFLSKELVQTFHDAYINATKGSDSTCVADFVELNTYQQYVLEEHPAFVEWIQSAVTKRALTRLAGSDVALFFTSGIGIHGSAGTGSSEHVDVGIFGEQKLEDLGFSMWIPTSDVDAKRGGRLRVTPKDKVDGKLFFQIPRYLDFDYLEKIKDSNILDYSSKLKDGTIEMESPEMEVGDVLFFHKLSVHATDPLKDPNDFRLALTFRFVDAESRYRGMRTRQFYDDDYNLPYYHQGGAVGSSMVGLLPSARVLSQCGN